MSNNIEWLIGEYRSQKDKVIGLQCDVAALVRKNQTLYDENVNLRTALAKIRDGGKDDQSELGWAADVAETALAQ